MEHEAFLMNYDKSIAVCTVGGEKYDVPCDVYIAVDIDEKSANIVTASDVAAMRFDGIYLGTEMPVAIAEIVEETTKEIKTAKRDIREIKDWYDRISKKAVSEDEEMVRRFIEIAEGEELCWHDPWYFTELPDFDEMRPFATFQEGENDGGGYFVIDNGKHDFNTYIMIINDEVPEEYRYDAVPIGSYLAVIRMFWRFPHLMYFGNNMPEENLQKAKEYLKKCPQTVLKRLACDGESVLWNYTHALTERPHEMSERVRLLKEEKRMMAYIAERKASGDDDMMFSL